MVLQCTCCCLSPRSCLCGPALREQPVTTGLDAAAVAATAAAAHSSKSVCESALLASLGAPACAVQVDPYTNATAATLPLVNQGPLALATTGREPAVCALQKQQHKNLTMLLARKCCAKDGAQRVFPKEISLQPIGGYLRFPCYCSQSAPPTPQVGKLEKKVLVTSKAANALKMRLQHLPLRTRLSTSLCHNPHFEAKRSNN